MPALSDEHAEAIADAYELVEIVQGQDDGGRVAVADQAAAGHGWADVRVLLDFARSLAAREAGVDDAAHVEKMIERATTLDDPALLALAWATSANRRTTTRRSPATGTRAGPPPLAGSAGRSPTPGRPGSGLGERAGGRGRLGGGRDPGRDRPARPSPGGRRGLAVELDCRASKPPPPARRAGRHLFSFFFFVSGRRSGTGHPVGRRRESAQAAELAALRWNNRLDRLAGVRDGIAVERRRDHEHLRRQGLVDDLTGLANRRGYRTYLDGVLQQPADDGYAVLMIDVDHFKTVNDRFGHGTGDIVLARLGEILTAHVRPIDLAARLGGDEFVVILADVTDGVPELRAQAVIDAVRRHPWTILAAGLTVSISVGVHHGPRRDLPTLLTDADRHLYHAKHHGRGRLSTG